MCFLRNWASSESGKKKIGGSLAAFCVVGVVVWLVCHFVFSSDESFGGPYKRETIATDTQQCSEIGKDILNVNGSAVDAAIAAMFCLGVVSMHSSGIGGGGVMLVYDQPIKKATVIDFRETAPATADRDISRVKRKKPRKVCTFVYAWFFCGPIVNNFSPKWRWMTVLV